MSWRSYTLADAYDPKRNNLNLFRLLLALAVIVSHSYPIALGLEAGSRVEPLRQLTHGRLDLGGLAVDAFFAISGFLLAGSWLAGRGDFLGFVRRRALRIYPGFFVCVLVCISLIGPSCVPDVRAYFADPHTYRLLKYLYFGRFWNSLPGCFAHNPMPEIINSSLWTIKYEVYCYVAIVLLGVGRLLRGPVVAGAALVCLTAFTALTLAGLSLPFALDPNYMPRLLTFFLGGAAAYLLRSSIPIRPWLFALAGLVLVATVRLPVWSTVLPPTAGLYCLLYAACLPGRLNAFGRRHDLSYGVYLYAWPVQQMAVYFGVGRESPWTLTAVAVPLTVVVAAASWFIVEGPALRYKVSSARKARPAAPEPPLVAATELEPSLPAGVTDPL